MRTELEIKKLPHDINEEAAKNTGIIVTQNGSVMNILQVK